MHFGLILIILFLLDHIHDGSDAVNVFNFLGDCPVHFQLELGVVSLSVVAGLDVASLCLFGVFLQHLGGHELEEEGQGFTRGLLELTLPHSGEGGRSALFLSLMSAEDVAEARVGLLAVSLHPAQNSDNHCQLSYLLPILFRNILILDESVGDDIRVNAFPGFVLSFGEEVRHKIMELLRGLSGEIEVESNQEVNVQVAKVVLPQLLHELTYP
jgi:hypothetical protein